MNKISRVILSVMMMSVCPMIAGAVGTYYDGNLYQKPRADYGRGNGGFYNNYGAGRGYGQNMQTIGMQQTTVRTTKKTSVKQNDAAKKQGFQLGVDLKHEFADWNFDMKNAGSKLHYDNLRWNTVNGEAAYYFGDSLPMQIKAGAFYGMQYGDSFMVDDDITSEKMWTWDESLGVIIGTPAVSVGTSNGGKQYGFNVSFGLTDFFKMGRVRFTPSVGYRYFKYNLETKDNYGAMVEVWNGSIINCLEVMPGEIQCSPYVGFAGDDGLLGNPPTAGSFVEVNPADYPNNYAQVTNAYGQTIYIKTNDNGTYVVPNDTTMPQLDLGNTYYYEQSGVSHKYETEWAGPYIALDMEYTINDNNFVNAGVEFGLPIYDAKGDQPYRIDWAHPTSVEDKGDFGDAYHLGLNAMWSTAITDNVMLSLGMTYDYYKVSGATAKTYLNATEYQQALTNVEYNINVLESMDSLTEDQQEWLALYKAERDDFNALKAAGWTQESKNEIESIYKSMGIRLGVNVKF